MALSDEQIKRITGGEFKIKTGVSPERTAATRQATTQRQERPGRLQQLAQDIARPFLKTAVTGVSAVRGAAALATGDIAGAERATRTVDLGFFGKISPVGARAETVGQFAREIGGTGLELGASLVGGGGVGRTAGALFKRQLAKAIGKGAKVGAVSGGLAGAGTAIEEGEGVAGTAVRTGLGAVAGGVAGGTLGATGVGLTAAVTPIKTLTTNVAPLLKNLGTKIETSLIKPRKSDLTKGFKTENVFKHNLGGTLQESYEKSTNALSSLRDEARQLRDGNEKVVDIGELMSQTADEITGGKLKQFGTNKQIAKAFEDFVSEFEQIVPDGKLTVPEAQEVKEAVGSLGSWLFGSRDLDSNAQQKVANALYTKLARSIETNSKPGLREINKTMSEIIPIKNALLQRIPVAERNNLLSLTDVISLGVSLQNPKGWGLALLNRLTKSGGFAEKVFKAGTKIENIGK